MWRHRQRGGHDVIDEEGGEEVIPVQPGGGTREAITHGVEEVVGT